MGSGKTTLGKKLAKKLSLNFLDLDTAIEESEGETISKIFEIHGEEYFRAKEHEILKLNCTKKNTLIACGGGTPCFYDNMILMNKIGITVYLKYSAEVLYSRLEIAKNSRPLLKNLDQNNMRLYINNKLAERENTYIQSKVIIDGLKLNMDAIITSVLKNI